MLLKFQLNINFVGPHIFLPSLHSYYLLLSLSPTPANLGGPQHIFHVKNSPSLVGLNMFTPPVVKDEPASVSANRL